MRKLIPREVLKPKEAEARICTINHSIMELWGRSQPIFCSNPDWHFGSQQKPKTESLSNPLLLKTHVYFKRNLFHMFLTLLHLSHSNCMWTEFDIWRNFWVILSASSIKNIRCCLEAKWPKQAPEAETDSRAPPTTAASEMTGEERLFSEKF